MNVEPIASTASTATTTTVATTSETIRTASSTNVGIAIFVKTPGVSPIKTRLGAAIGPEAAERFHCLAASCVAEAALEAARHLADAETQAKQSSPQSTTKSRATDAQAYWAVAESEAMDAPIWSALPRIAQGDGTLGERMRRVYDMLRTRHDAAILIGADAPQLRSDDLLAACAQLRIHDAVLGPSEDGGFWLLGGRIAIADTAWTCTPWSQADTFARFAAAAGIDAPAALPRLRDVDTLEDLRALTPTLTTIVSPTPAQDALMRWLRAYPV
jgi:uncharacterized protein